MTDLYGEKRLLLSTQQFIADVYTSILSRKADTEENDYLRVYPLIDKSIPFPSRATILFWMHMCEVMTDTGAIGVWLPASWPSAHLNISAVDDEGVKFGINKPFIGRNDKLAMQMCSNRLLFLQPIYDSSYKQVPPYRISSSEFRWRPAGIINDVGAPERNIHHSYNGRSISNLHTHGIGVDLPCESRLPISRSGEAVQLASKAWLKFYPNLTPRFWLGWTTPEEAGLLTESQKRWLDCYFSARRELFESLNRDQHPNAFLNACAMQAVIRDSELRKAGRFGNATQATSNKQRLFDQLAGTKLPPIQKGE